VQAFTESPTYQIQRQNVRVDALRRRFQELFRLLQRQEVSLQAVGPLKAEVVPSMARFRVLESLHSRVGRLISIDESFVVIG
jgi:hypothetical protein